MIFFDASAAAKRYFQEIGSDRVNKSWSGPEILSSLAILPCELISALNRKRRERTLPRGAYQTLKKQIGEDVGKIPVVPINAELIELSLRLLDAYPLKTLDSLYLAGALALQLALKEKVLFIAADRQLLQAAQAEGLRTLNPETGL
ncbi:MAG: type II toxin-antitoxin system VapC family toxin [Terriglobia bacterium]